LRDLRESGAARKRLAAHGAFCSCRGLFRGGQPMKIMSALLSSALLVAAPATAQQTAPRADQLAFRDLYKELVETDTTLSAGSCTLAAERMRARLRAGGFGDDQLTLSADPDHPKGGGLVAV